jgi:chromosome segregation ATPase
MGVAAPGALDKLKDKEKVSVLEQRIQFQGENIDNQKKQLAEYKEEMAKLKEILEKLSSSVQTQTGTIADQQRTLKDQESTILEQQKSLSGLQKQLAEAQNNLDAAKSQLGDSDGKTREKTDQLKSQLVALKRTLEAKQAEFNDTIAKREDTIKELRIQSANQDRKATEVESLKGRAVSGESAALARKIIDLEKVLADADNTIRSLEKQLQENKARLENEIQVRDVKIEEYERIIKSKPKPELIIKNFIENREGAFRALIDIFSRTKSNVMIFSPDASILNSIDFDNVRPSARVFIAIPEIGRAHV